MRASPFSPNVARSCGDSSGLRDELGGVRVAEVSRRAQFLLGSCVFTSGACALGFEVVWAKQLSVVLGGTTAGIAFVVAIFMGGMALGYAVGGRVAARVARPIAAYGICELGLALLALGAAFLAPTL